MMIQIDGICNDMLNVQRLGIRGAGLHDCS